MTAHYFRCKCGKLLAIIRLPEGVEGSIETKCPRCHILKTLETCAPLTAGIAAAKVPVTT